MFNSVKKKEVPSAQSNSQIYQNQNSQYIPSTSFINPLMYQHLFNQFMQTNSYFLPSHNNPIQMQAQENFANVNMNVSRESYANMNMNISHESYANTNMISRESCITNANTNIIQDNSANTQLQKIQSLTIEQFLENLDKEFGDGKFTKYLNAFKEQEIDVLDIINLKDSDWVTLGIEKIGPKSKIIRALDKYNR